MLRTHAKLGPFTMTWLAMGAVTMAACGHHRVAPDAQPTSSVDPSSLSTDGVPTSPDAAAPRCRDGQALVPSSTFKRGGDGESVTLAAFCIDRTEVTVAAYERCVGAGKCAEAERGGACNSGIPGRQEHPINGVDWYQAAAYCEAQGLRLPTEDEWELAAYGTDARKFPWGDDAPVDQLCGGGPEGDGNGRESSCAVGSFPKGRSPFGLDDMAGNVKEWTASGKVPADTQETGVRVYRGGSWQSGAYDLARSQERHELLGATGGLDLTGFRCAGTPLTAK